MLSKRNFDSGVWPRSSGWLRQQGERGPGRGGSSGFWVVLGFRVYRVLGKSVAGGWGGDLGRAGINYHTSAQILAIQRSWVSSKTRLFL